jgi:hypothetical protein
VRGMLLWGVKRELGRSESSKFYLNFILKPCDILVLNLCFTSTVR